MERETDIKYSILGQYDTKQVFRCNYARENRFNDVSTAYFCPSSMVVQDFSKGIQVHFYKKHYGHMALEYTLASKYLKYSITSFLKSPNDVKGIKAAINGKKLEDKDLFPHFKTLMQSIIMEARNVEIPKLQLLIERALEMTEVLIVRKDTAASSTQQGKVMSDKEIVDELECKDTQKRRLSMDSFTLPKSPAKRIRNRSVFTQSEDRSSPKIVNTFSLAPYTNGGNLTVDAKDVIVGDTDSEPAALEPEKAESNPDEDQKPINAKSFSKTTCFTESPSFNDSYKDFIDKTIKANIDADLKVKKPVSRRVGERTTRSNAVVKTKMGTFKPTSPKTDGKGNAKADVKDVLKDDAGEGDVNKNVLAPKKLNNANNKLDEATPKVTKVKNTAPKVASKVVMTKYITSHNATTKATTPKDVTPKVAMPKVATPKAVTPKPVTAKDVTPKLVTPKAVTPKAVTPKVAKAKVVTTKVAPKVEDVHQENRAAAPLSVLKPKPKFRYEVREQENDCNILVLKF